MKNISSFRRGVVLKFIMAIMILGIVLFLPAGSFKYWEAWVYCGVLFIPVIFVLNYFLKRSPKLLERRMRFKEKVKEQKMIIAVSNIIFLIGFLIPGFDHRYQWSDVPISFVIIADIVIFLGYMIVVLTFRENSYASRIIEVEKGQKLVTTGPYSIIRHPMYLGVLLMMMFTPIALGSYWGLMTFIPIVIILVLRTLNEEKVMMKELLGYKKYAQKVRYRIIPFLW